MTGPRRTLPAECHSMTALRDQIDSIDRELVSLLSERARYIDRAIDLKRIEGLPARTTDRVAEVISAVRALAATYDLDADLAEDLWRILIDWGIARETPHLHGDG